MKGPLLQVDVRLADRLREGSKWSAWFVVPTGDAASGTQNLSEFEVPSRRSFFCLRMGGLVFAEYLNAVCNPVVNFLVILWRTIQTANRKGSALSNVFD